MILPLAGSFLTTKDPQPSNDGPKLLSLAPRSPDVTVQALELLEALDDAVAPLAHQPELCSAWREEQLMGEGVSREGMGSSSLSTKLQPQLTRVASSFIHSASTAE